MAMPLSLHSQRDPPVPVSCQASDATLPPSGRAAVPRRRSRQLVETSSAWTQSPLDPASRHDEYDAIHTVCLIAGRPFAKLSSSLSATEAHTADIRPGIVHAHAPSTLPVVARSRGYTPLPRLLVLVGYLKLWARTLESCIPFLTRSHHMRGDRDALIRASRSYSRSRTRLAHVLLTPKFGRVAGVRTYGQRGGRELQAGAAHDGASSTEWRVRGASACRIWLRALPSPRAPLLHRTQLRTHPSSPPPTLTSKPCSCTPLTPPAIVPVYRHTSAPASSRLLCPRSPPSHFRPLYRPFGNPLRRLLDLSPTPTVVAAGPLLRPSDSILLVARNWAPAKFALMPDALWHLVPFSVPFNLVGMFVAPVTSLDPLQNFIGRVEVFSIPSALATTPLLWLSSRFRADGLCAETMLVQISFKFPSVLP
ncbi:hypothetical protein B0H17DRAFT_1197473 [Mycena rosella]|uniref:Uncharacterized protein n=1 Tax=Mycena rosella TaxID=1033263 RepID=A0AAD7DSQ2_MYCRO|nr:hypothetical protein B0H17DRAFT_1197473 [Mycena rosella]